MKCHQAEAWMDAALDVDFEEEAGLPAGRRVELELHLQQCARCREQWELLRAADVALRVPRPHAAPEGMLQEFRHRLAAESGGRVEADAAPQTPQARRVWPWLWPLGSVAAAGATAALALSFNLLPLTPRGEAPAPERRTSAIPSPAPEPLLRKAEPGPAMTARRPTVSEEPAKVPSASAQSGARVLPRQHSPRLVHPVPTPISAEASGKPRREETPRVAAAPRPALGLSETKTSSPPPRTEVTIAPVAPAVESGPRAQSVPPPMEEGETPVSVAARAPLEGEPRVGLELRADGPRALGAPGPVALGAEIQVKQAELLPPELNVSPALLTALQRRVEMKADVMPVRQLAAQLTEKADVLVRVDPQVPVLRLRVDQEKAPFWMVLETVARQGRLEIHPEANQLVLRPAQPGKDALMDRPTPLTQQQAMRERPMRKPKIQMFGTERIDTLQGMQGAARNLEVQPDRRVWPAEWGNLPERGFAVPGPEEIPASVAALSLAPPHAEEPPLAAPASPTSRRGEQRGREERK